MKIYLVMWSEVDSGYEIKAAYKSKSAARAKAKALNDLDIKKAIQETAKWIKTNPEAALRVYRQANGEPYPTQAKAEQAARKCTLDYATRAGSQRHYVEVVNVIELEKEGLAT